MFVFSTNGDTDLVKDFEDDIDSFDLRAFGFSSVAEAKSYAKNDNGNAVFVFESGVSVTLLGTTVQDLSNDILI